MRYEIAGESTPVVICDLNDGESMITESGSMVWMTDNIRMQTGAQGVRKALGRILTGENIFRNVFTAEGGIGTVAFASSFPGSIVPIEISDTNSVIVQKSAFLCSEMGVDLSVYLQKKIGTGLFGGEGFIMQRLSGYGTAFLEIDGYCKGYMLQPGQRIIVNTGNLVMIEDTCDISIQTVKGFNNVVFGGEGLFHTVVTGPGKVLLQSMTIGTMANLLYPYMPQPQQN